MKKYINFSMKTYLDCTYKKSSLLDDGEAHESHCHNLFELILVYQGKVDVIIENKHFKISKPTAVLIPPQMYHTISYSVYDCI